MLISVQFVISKDIITISLDPSIAAEATATVLLLKGKIRDDTGFRLDMMQLTYRDIVLQDNDRLCDQCIGDDSTLLRLAIKPEYSPHPSQQSYEGFLGFPQFLDAAGQSVSPLELPPAPAPAIVLQTKTDQHRSKLDLQSLLELVQNDDSSVSMKQTFGYAEAKKRGFVQWTSSHLVYQRVMLLEVNMLGRGGGGGGGVSESASLGGEGDMDREKKVLEDRRYRYDGVTRLYRGGDCHSWQRYTRHTPVPCTLRLDASLQQLTVSPNEPLKPRQEYVVLLMHGGKVMCGGGGRGEVGVDEEEEAEEEGEDDALFQVLSDHLIFFTTAPSSPLPSSLPSPLSPSSSLHKRRQHQQSDSSTSFSLYQHVDFSISPQNYSNDPTFSIILSNFDDKVPVKCLALKKAIYNSIGLAPSDQQLVINGQICLSDDDDLTAFHLLRHSSSHSNNNSQCPSPCLQHRNLVHLLPVVASLRNQMAPALHSAVSASLHPYIQSVFPANGTQNVSTHVMIEIQFKSTCQNVTLGEDNGLSLQLDSSSNRSGACQLDSHVAVQCFVQPAKEGKERSTTPGQGSRDRDRDMERRLGGEEARRRGFTRWLGGGDKRGWQLQKLFVLEVTQGAQAKNVLQNRYEFSPWRGRNGRYTGGDCFSWQRYTDKEPLSGVVEVSECSTAGQSSGQSSVLFRPSAPLKPSTLYVVVLANGVEVVSQLRAKGGGGGGASSSSRNSSGCGSSGCSSWTEDDALFFFSTEPERGGHSKGRDSSRSEHAVVEGDSREAYEEEGYSGTMCYGLSSSSSGGEPALCILS